MQSHGHLAKLPGSKHGCLRSPLLRAHTQIGGIAIGGSGAPPGGFWRRGGYPPRTLITQQKRTWELTSAAAASGSTNVDGLKEENARLLKEIQQAEEAALQELLEQNNELRVAVSKAWAGLPASSKQTFLSEHEALRAAAVEEGIALPPLGDPSPATGPSKGSATVAEPPPAAVAEPPPPVAEPTPTVAEEEPAVAEPVSEVGSNGATSATNGSSPPPEADPVQTSADADVVSDGEVEARIVKEKDGTVSFSFGGLVDMMKNIGRGGDPPQAGGGGEPHPLIARLVPRALSGKRVPEASPRRGARAFAEAGEAENITRTTPGGLKNGKHGSQGNGSGGNGQNGRSAGGNGKKRTEAEIVAMEAGGGAEDTSADAGASIAPDGPLAGRKKSPEEILAGESGGGAEMELPAGPLPTVQPPGRKKTPEEILAGESGGRAEMELPAGPLPPVQSPGGSKAEVDAAVQALLAGEQDAYDAAVQQVLASESEAALSSLRQAISAAVGDHDVAAITANKPDWRYFVFPQRPVAGADVVIYLNKSTNDMLRFSNRVQVHALFNNWELGGPSGDWFDLKSVEKASKDGNADWWSVTIPTPEDAFELNYIFGDGEGQTDNNGGLDYKTFMAGFMTAEKWEELAPDRLAAEETRRQEAERAQRETAAREAEAAALRADAAAGAEAAAAAIREYQGLQLGASATHPAWQTQPEVLRPNTSGVIFYNAAETSLAFMSPLPQPPTLRVGHNGWRDTKDVEMVRAEGRGEGDWWQAPVDVPEGAAVLNFVIQYYEHFDNNGGLDYKISVGLPKGFETLEEWESAMSEEFRQEAFARRKKAEAAWARKVEKRAAQRAATKAKAKDVGLRQMKHVLFTEPATLTAGQEATLFYNPNNTCLHGRDQIFLKGGWNRWSHKQGFGPLQMQPPAEGGEHFQARITIPKNAYRMDFVFSDVADGPGTYDNRGGLDYGLPVEGCVIREPSLYVVHIAVEMAPICKVGGLGDVVTALGRAVQEEGNMVEVILPRYNFFLQSPLLGATVYETEFDFRGTHVWVSTCVVEGLRCFFIEPANGFFAVDSVYGRNDDAVRFDWFCAAALEFLLQTGRQPDIIHCHDWSTASTAALYWNDYHHFGLGRPKMVFTIHNAEFGLAKIGEAAHHSQRFTTVSPKYREDICFLPAISKQSHKFVGIRNGIDADIWDPENDQFLPQPYNADTVVEGKKAAREALRYRLGLTGWGDKPIVGVVSRLTAQKGIHLIKHTAYRTLERGGQFVLLGSAPDPRVQAEFNSLNAQMRSENAAFCFSYDEPLSHLIYAGCDLIVVPSMFEPCGLTQMIAMRYGSIPVVRHTGGLYDTVFDVDNDKARAAWQMEGSGDFIRDEVEATNGFAFEGTDPMALDYALNRALDTYYNDREWFNKLAKRVMLQDWSWARPALDYIELYYQAMKND